MPQIVGVGYGGGVGVGVGVIDGEGIGHQKPQHGGCVGAGVTTGHHTPGFGTHGVGSGVGVYVGDGVGVGSSHNEHCNPIDVSTQTGQLSLSIVTFVHVPVVTIVVIIPSCGSQYSDAPWTIPISEMINKTEIKSLFNVYAPTPH